jgi:hypothetical protein
MMNAVSVLVSYLQISLSNNQVTLVTHFAIVQHISHTLKNLCDHKSYSTFYCSLSQKITGDGFRFPQHTLLTHN